MSIESLDVAGRRRAANPWLLRTPHRAALPGRPRRPRPPGNPHRLSHGATTADFQAKSSLVAAPRG